jgi:hypothetical protein
MERLGFPPTETHEEALLAFIHPYSLTWQIIADMIIRVRNPKSEARNLKQARMKKCEFGLFTKPSSLTISQKGPFSCHFERSEKSNAKHCPEQREGSIRHREILPSAQDDLLWQVRFLPAVEMTDSRLTTFFERIK